MAPMVITWFTLVLTAVCMGYSVGSSRWWVSRQRGLIAASAVVLGFVESANAGIQSRSWLVAGVAAAVWLGVFVAVYRPVRARGRLLP